MGQLSRYFFPPLLSELLQLLVLQLCDVGLHFFGFGEVLEFAEALLDLPKVEQLGGRLGRVRHAALEVDPELFDLQLVVLGEASDLSSDVLFQRG